MPYASPTAILQADFDRVASRLAAIVPEIDPAVRAGSSSPVGVLAGAALQVIIESFSAADDAIFQAGATITNAGLSSPLAMRQMMSDAANRVSNTIAGLLATATAAADALAVKLNRLAVAPRPATTDPVLQEAQVSAIKADVAMVLDRCSTANLATTTAGLIADFASQGDDLAVWLLASSTWPAMYFQSRGVALDSLTCLIPKALGGADDPEMVLARQILAAFDGRSGLRALIVIAIALAQVGETDLRKTYGIAAA